MVGSLFLGPAAGPTRVAVLTIAKCAVQCKSYFRLHCTFLLQLVAAEQCVNSIQLDKEIAHVGVEHV